MYPAFSILGKIGIGKNEAAPPPPPNALMIGNSGRLKSYPGVNSFDQYSHTTRPPRTL